MRRPALFSALWFAFGIGMQVICQWSGVWLLVLGICLMLTVVVLFVLKQDFWASTGCCLLLILLGALRFEWGVRQMPGDHYCNVLSDDEVIFTGQLVSEPERQTNGWRAEMEVMSVCRGDTLWQTSGRMLVRFGEQVTEATYGDHLALRVVPTLPEPARNPGGFDYRDYLALRGIRALAYVSRNKQVLLKEEHQGAWWMEGVISVRGTIRGAIEQNLSGGPAGLLKGILLGDKRAVPTEVRDAFTRCGVNHVLAVSGLHVGLIA
ncbi:MAG: ComEC/Rec2 family competence protein, partial [Candidatus Latescibacterota bacterium]